LDDTHYTTIKRIGAIIVALALWFLSLRFSVQGFSIQVPNLVWAGWVLGFAVTVIELIFTSENRGRNMTLTFLGIAAYTYGVWSNIIGIYSSRGAIPDGGGYINTNMVFSIILGLILEIAPEPLFLWGLLGTETAEGDFVATIGKIWTNAQKRPVGRPRKDRGYSSMPSMPDLFSKRKKDDTVSIRDAQTGQIPQTPNYHAVTRLTITQSLNNFNGRLVWDKNKSQSPILSVGSTLTPVSRSLVRQMVEEKVLIAKSDGMIVTYILSGSEPPIQKGKRL